LYERLSVELSAYSRAEIKAVAGRRIYDERRARFTDNKYSNVLA
jgi:hypothetical protein